MLRRDDVYGQVLMYRAALAKDPSLWQFDLLSADAFCQFCRNKGLLLSQGVVEDLWKVGLLRADLIRIEGDGSLEGLLKVAQEEAFGTFIDVRKVPNRDQGYGGCFQTVPSLPDGTQILFHPFRLNVVHHIVRVFETHVSFAQFLMNPNGVGRATAFEYDHLQDWTSKREFADRFEDWNRVAEIAAILEPIAHEVVFESFRWRHPDSENSLRDRLSSFRESARLLLSSVSPSEVDEVRKSLCVDAELVDQNKMLHVLLRLMSGHERLKIRDGLGRALQFKSMAEVIRRAFEDARKLELREEDELGFGQWMAGARKLIYGSERVLDASLETRRDFLTSMGLDSGVKARCYVEGQSELGALKSAVGDSGGLEFVNLAGQVLERHGQELRFVDSLATDKRSHVFSVVLIDADRVDSVRALKRAASDGRFFGRFFLSDPDFEFANFSKRELLEAAFSLEFQSGAEVPDRVAAEGETSHSRSGAEFVAGLKRAGFSSVQKSEVWGAVLMKSALANPALPTDHPGAGGTRPIVQAAKLLQIARSSGYLRSVENSVVDPETGQLRKKSS